MGRKRSEKQRSRRIKGLNEAVAETLGGVAGKADAALFFEDTVADLGPGHAQARARRKRAELERREAEELEIAKTLKKTAEKAGLAKAKVGLAEAKKKVPDATKVHVAKSRAKAGVDESAALAAGDLWSTGPEDVAAGSWAELPRKPGLKRGRKAEKPAAHVAPVKVAHPGASYHPTADDCKQALTTAVKKALQHQSLKEKESRIDAKERAKAIPYPDPNDDMSESESESEEEQDDDDEEETKIDEEGASSGQKKKAKKPEPGRKLTQTERNKMRRHAIEMSRQRARRVKKAIDEKYKKLPEIAEQVEEREAKNEERRERRAKRRAAEALEEPVLRMATGRVMRNIVPAVDAVLPSDLSGSMRTIKPHANLALDRMRSMQMRSMLEVPDPEAFKRNKRKKLVKDIVVGKKFIEEKLDKGEKRKRRRMLPGGRVDISV